LVLRQPFKLHKRGFDSRRPHWANRLEAWRPLSAQWIRMLAMIAAGVPQSEVRAKKRSPPPW
jgi:hypothetical protein